MPRPEKVAAVAEIRNRFGDATATVLTEYRGLTVSELAQLRAQLRDSQASYAVVKNTLTRLAVRDAGVDIPDEMLTGPTAVTFCAGDPIAVAKVLRAFSRDHPELVVKGGILEGRLLGAAETLELADLASREDLLAQLAGMMQSIVAQPARLALANLSKAARLFAALQDKKEQGAEGAGPQGVADPSDAASPDLAATGSPAETPGNNETEGA